MNERLTREVAGGRDAFYDNPESDRLLAMLMRFMTDHWALRERVKILEALLVEGRVLNADAIDKYQANPEQATDWDMESFRFIQAVVEAGQNIER